MRKIAILFALFGVMLNANAQLDLGLFTMNNQWKKSQLNPAHAADERMTIAFPGLAFAFNHSGDPFANVWSVENQTLIIDTEQWLDNLEPSNDFRSRFELATLEVAFRNKNWTWSLGHTFRNGATGNYSKSLVELLHNGNAPYIGDTLQLNADLEWRSVSAFHLGLSWGLDNFRVGGRVHFLNGIQFLNMNNSQVDLYTDPEAYQLTFLTDAMIQSSSFLAVEDIDALSFEFTGLEVYDLFTKNNGLAFDIGAQMDISSSLMAEVSLLDLGFIRWDETEVYQSNTTVTYDGVEVSDLSNFDSLSFSEALDTLGRLLEFESRTESGFRESLNSRLYLGLHWQVNEKLGLSGVYANTTWRDEAVHAFGLGLRYQAFKWWNIGTMVNRRYDRWSWGLNTQFDFGMVELYFTSDNLISVFGISSLENSTIRVGANLVFGEVE